jgi:hypothetical protein
MLAAATQMNPLQNGYLNQWAKNILVTCHTVLKDNMKTTGRVEKTRYFITDSRNKK